MMLAWAFLAVWLGQIVKGATGFGSALVAIPVLARVFSPAEGVLLLTALDALGGVWLVRGALPLVRWRLVLAMFPAMFAGQLLGGALLLRLDPAIVRGLVFVIVAAFGGKTLLWPVVPGRGELEELPPAPRLLREGAVAGFLGGAMAGVVGASGPPIVAFMRRHFTDQFGRAQLVALFQLGALSLCAQLLLGGVADAQTAWRFVALIPALATGLGIGAWLGPKLSRETFGRLVGILLLLSAGTILL